MRQKSHFAFSMVIWIYYTTFYPNRLYKIYRFSAKDWGTLLPDCIENTFFCEKWHTFLDIHTFLLIFETLYGTLYIDRI